MPTEQILQLPAANEFSVGQLGGRQALLELLATIESANGDRNAIIEAIRVRWFANSAAARQDPQQMSQQQVKRAQNVISGMRQYGLLNKSKDPIELSELGQAIGELHGQPEKAYRLFVEFLLKHRHGYELLELARDVMHRDGAVSKSAMDSELLSRGYRVSTNSSYSGKLRAWLGITGLVDDGWSVNEELLAELSGVTHEEVSGWRSLTTAQRATVEILRIRDEGNRSEVQSSDLLNLLRARGIEFNTGQVRRQIYDPLSKGGWISHRRREDGRGGKGGFISLTDLGRDLDAAFIEGLELGTVPPDLQVHLGLPIDRILADLESPDKHVKGIALELLALRLASDIGLLPVELRQRGIETGGAEVDLVAEGAGLHFSRWLFQCKNQAAPVGLPVLAKELGMAVLLKAQIVVIVTTGLFARSVRDYAKQAAESTSVQVVLLDGESLKRYRNHGVSALRNELHAHALAALSRKREQLLSVPRAW